ncbi:phage virion morphogenesis protein [Pantoea agglomerans]
MLLEVARDVRRIQQASITAQRSLDGIEWEPRRVSARIKKGLIRRGMFAKLETTKYLKVKTNADATEVAFIQGGRSWPASIITVCATVSRRGPMVKYPERPMLDANNDVEISVCETLLQWLVE